MLMTEKQFYEEELDLSIPALAKACELYKSGSTAEAENAFAEYLKSYLDCDRYFEYAGRKSAVSGSVGDPAKNVTENADLICRGIVRSCSFTYDFGGEIIWRKNGTPDGYREWTYQLNRHNIFKTLALAYLDTGDEKYAEAFSRHMNGWLDQEICPGWPVPNRCSQYPCWRTISAGIRQNSNWPFAIHSFINSPTISDHTWVRIAMSIWEHGQFLMNSPSSLNWLDIEMAGLNAVGTLYRFFKQSETWRSFAVNLMARELETQVYEDGFQAELTTGYQSVVTSTYLSIYNLARKYELPVPDGFADKIKLMFTMYPKLMRPDGRTPITNDGSQVVVKERMEHALIHFPGDPLFTAVRDGRVSEIYPLDVVMPYSGMITMRTGWGPDDVWLFFESAPFGAGHQHNDKLNINLSAYGKNLINVIGNFAYDKSKMRHLSVCTRGHSTGIVDGKGQNARPTHTAWSPEKVNIKSDLQTNITDDVVVAYGKYERGYGEELIPVKHERRVVFFRKGLGGSLPFFVILDDFLANDELDHKYELNFLPPVAPVLLNGRQATVMAGDGVTLEIVTHTALSTVCGANAPEYMGFRPSDSRLAKEHVPMTNIIVYDWGKEAHFATVLYPTPDGAAPKITVRRDAESFTVVLDDEEHTIRLDDEIMITKPV